MISAGELDAKMDIYWDDLLKEGYEKANLGKEAKGKENYDKETKEKED